MDNLVRNKANNMFTVMAMLNQSGFKNNAHT